MKKAFSLLLALVMCLSLCACGGNDTPETEAPTETTAPIQTEPQNTTIEITLDNWMEYFEFRRVVVDRRNGFNELTEFYPNMNMCLKPEWAEVATEMEVAVEYSCMNGYRQWFTYNADTKELTEGEIDSGSALISDLLNQTLSLKDYSINDGKILYGASATAFEIKDNIATVLGTTYSDVEIIRIQGTITIAK